MARAPSRMPGGLFGGWTATSTPDGRVVWRQAPPARSLRGLLGIEVAGPYSRVPGVGRQLTDQLRQSVAPWGYNQSVPREPFTGRQQQFLREIGRHEGAGYDTAFGMRPDGKSLYITPKEFSGKQLTDMTLQEVFAYQDRLRQATGRTSAVGRGQFQEDTLRRNLEDMKITDFAHTRYDPDLQDRLIINNARLGRRLDPNVVETWSREEKVRLGKEWESLDVSKGKITAQDLDRMLARISAESVEYPVRAIGAERMARTPAAASPRQVARSAPVHGGRGNERTRVKPRQPPRATPREVPRRPQATESWWDRYFDWW